jgi:DNA repair protein RecO (recombination protein O)
MLTKTQGIVLKNTRYSDNSVISKIYTRNFGIQTYMVNGIHSPKAAIKPSLLQPLMLLDMVVYHHPSKNIQRIKEAKSQPVLHELHFDVLKSATGMFMAELIYRTIKEEEPNEGLYSFIENSILQIDNTQGSIVLWPLYFSVHLTQWLGFFPNDNWSEENQYFSIEEGSFISFPAQHQHCIEPPHSRYLSEILAVSIDNLTALTIPKASRTLILAKMIDYYSIHVTGFAGLRSLQVLTSLMKED